MPAYESRYAGRRPDAAVVNLTLDVEALAVLERHCPRGRRNLGHFIARLLYEHQARTEERLRLQQAQQATCGEETSRD